MPEKQPTALIVVAHSARPDTGSDARPDAGPDALRERTVRLARAAGFDCELQSDPERALAMLTRRPWDLIVFGPGPEPEQEIALLDRARAKRPGAAAIVVTAMDDITHAARLMRHGAFHCLPPDAGDEHIREALGKVRMRNQSRPAAARDKDLPELIGKSTRMQELKRIIRRVAPLDCTVLLRGETGTGKELVAKIIHSISPRANNQFLAINCGAFNEDLLSNELFGHEKEAFTGAQRTKKGVFEALDGGAVLLDEIGEMPYNTQVQLLRVLQEKTVLRVGGTRDIPVDVRILAATNRPLAEQVEQGAFREDLYFRLNVFTVRIPPLRDRADDIPLFCRYFLDKYSKEFGKNVDSISDEVLSLFMAHPFPGNVRELENIIERAIVLADGSVIERRHLPRRFQPESFQPLPEPGRLRTLAEVEEDYIRHVLETVGGNKTRAAAILGIDRVSLWRRLKRASSAA